MILLLKIGQLFTPVRMGRCGTLTAPNPGQHVEPQELAGVDGGNAGRCGRGGGESVSYKTKHPLTIGSGVLLAS